MRTIVKIDEEKCDGCGQCIIGCAEGALQLVNGKAKLVKESYCDGLGACIGDCPRGAITIEEREAEPFDEEAVKIHQMETANTPSECPGRMAQLLTTRLRQPVTSPTSAPAALRNWPVQLALIPVQAPYLQQARLVLAADCVAYALPDFHSRFTDDRVVMIGCPKLDNSQLYSEKLAQILRHNDVESIEVVYMEVPCCAGLLRILERALIESGVDIDVTMTKVSIHGEVIDQVKIA
jgi:ferredoxin